MSETTSILQRAVFLKPENWRGLGAILRPLILGAEICLTAAIAYVLARLVWIVVEPGGAVVGIYPIVQTPRQVSEHVSQSLSGDLTSLVSRNPFGQAASTESVSPAAPETKLNLVLKGVRASGDGTGVAVIIMPNNRLQMFSAGESILDGVVLEKVYGDRVTLRKDGRIEALLMAGGADRLSVLSPLGQLTPRAATEAGAGTAITRTGANAFLANLSVNPVHRGQDFVGYQIGARMDEDLLERLGLRSGDILLAVDGTPVASTTPGDLITSLASTNTMRLRIHRDGREFDQTFTLPENP